MTTIARIGNYIAALDGSVVNAPSAPFFETATHYWPFDGSTNDIGNLANAPFNKFSSADISYTTGKIGEAAYFNVAGVMLFNSANAAINGNVPWSISLWFEPSTGTPNGNIFESSNSIPHTYFNINFGQVRVIRSKSGTTDTLSSTTIESGWNHIVYTYDSSLSNVYLNNVHVLVDEPTTVYGNTAGSGLIIGGLYNSWRGAIDLMRFYDYPITTDMVNSLWNGGAGI